MKDSSPYWAVKMLCTLTSAGSFQNSYFMCPTHTQTEPFQYLLHIFQKVLTHVFALLFSLTIMISLVCQNFAQPSRLKFKRFCFLDILKSPLTSSDWKGLPFSSQSSLKASQPSFICASCVSSSGLDTAYMKTKKTKLFFSNEQDIIWYRT